MRITKGNVLRAVERLTDAARADEVKGGGNPVSIPEIEEELRYAKREFYALLNELLATYYAARKEK